jgi:hypothetical protein
MEARTIHPPARKDTTMRIGRTIGLLTFFAGVATYFATRAALKRGETFQRSEQDDRLRWETDGGATAGGPQPAGAQFQQATTQ